MADVLFLVYRDGKGCRQYPFDSVADLAKWAGRLPYRGELLRIIAAIDCQPVANWSCMGSEAAGRASEFVVDHLQLKAAA